MKKSVLYLAIDVFSTGGIQRYSRAQIQALRGWAGEECVTTLVLHPRPEAGLGFDEPFNVTSVETQHNLYGRLHFILGALSKGLRLRPDVIWTNHVKLFPLANFLRFLCGAWAAVGNVYGLEVWSGLSWLEKFSIRRIDRIISDSHFTAKYLGEALRVQPQKVSVIWDPVDIRRFMPRDTAATILPRYGVPHRSNTCYVMTLGRVSAASRHKGYDRMLDVMRSIDRDDIIYLIVGDGDDRARLETRVRDEGLTGRVYFLGGVPEKELVDVYNAADIFVLVSDQGAGRGEGVPLTPLEAAACAVPIIVGNEDGSSEAVQEGANGFIVSPRNLDEIRSAILKLADDPVLRQSMGKAARLHIERYFSYDSFRDSIHRIMSGF